MPTLPTLQALRYVQPLREGGSLPAIVDTDDGLYVVKFRGAGQGAKVLIAELIVGMLARALGLAVPDLAIVEVAPLFGRTEPDPEIQDILRGSHGVNIGMRYLDGAFNFDGLAAGSLVDPDLAASIVWLDAFVTNPDRTHRNPNLLIWQRHAWLIDHGSALYAHHDWSTVNDARARTPFPLIKDHVLLARSGDLEAADAHLAPLVTETALSEVLAEVPDALLLDPHNREGDASGDDVRARYRNFLMTRLAPPRDFLAEAMRAKTERSAAKPNRLSARR